MILVRLLPWVPVILLLAVDPKPALAEFEIQESDVEKGEWEVEYRGAVHWGFPKAERGDDEDGALDEEEESSTRQSHDFELQWGVTDRWMVSTTLGTDQPLGDDYGVNSVEFEAQYEFIQRHGDGLGLAFTGAYGLATRDGEADEIEFGPIVELASGPLLLTINSYFSSQMGSNAETDSLGFEYGWRAEYAVAKRWGVGVEMFGEFEDLSAAGTFDSQEHSMGPTLFYNPGDDDDEGESVIQEDQKVAGPAEMEFSLNVGVQFGLTNVTPDTALKFQGSVAF